MPPPSSPKDNCSRGRGTGAGVPDWDAKPGPKSWSSGAAITPFAELSPGPHDKPLIFVNYTRQTR